MQGILIGNFEFHLANASVNRSGWSGDQANLPDETIEQIRALFTPGRNFVDWQFIQGVLTRIFRATLATQTFRLECCRAREWPHSSNTGNEDGRPKRRPKLATVTLQRIEKLERIYLVLRQHQSLDHGLIFHFLKTLQNDVAVCTILRHVVPRSAAAPFGFHRAIWYHNGIFESLEQGFIDAKAALRLAIKPGRSDPSYEQMVRALAALYFDTKGVMPGRWVHFVDRETPREDGTQLAVETGAFLVLCRLMANAVNDALPDNMRRHGGFDLVKPIRRMIAELKREIAFNNNLKELPALAIGP